MNGPTDSLGAVALVAALIAAAIGMLLVAQLAHSRSARQLRSRIAGVRGRSAAQLDQHPQNDNDVRKAIASKYPGLETIARYLMPRPALLRLRLEQTGLKISITRYAVICLAVGLSATLVRALAFDLPVLLSVLFGVVTGLGLPHIVLNFLIARRIRKFLVDFPEAIDLIIRGLKSGLPVAESIRIVGQEFGGPVGHEFALIADRVKFGESIEDAMWEAAARIDLADFKFFVVSLSVQRETGGNLAETLENLSDILRRRRHMKLKIKAMSSEARASAMILGSLPFVMFAILAAINPGYVMTLFSDPRGVLMVLFAFACLGVGVGVMWKMVRFEI